MSDKVRLNTQEIGRLHQWLQKNNVSMGHVVEIEVSHSSGIGPTIRASVWVNTKEGIMLDLTDVDSW